METTIVFQESEETTLAALRPGIAELAASFGVIRNDEHRTGALGFVKDVKGVREKVKGLFSDVIAQAHKLHKTLNERMKTLDAPFAEHEDAVRKAIGRYDDDLRAKQEAERRRVAEEARKAEAERQRLQAEADAAARKAAEDKRLADAEALEKVGRADLAQRAIETPVYVPPVAVVAPPVPVYVEPPRPKGMVVRWKHRVIDVRLVPREYMVVDDRLLASIATSQKDKASVPGVEFFTESSVRS